MAMANPPSAGAALAERKPAPPEERPDIWKSEGNARLTAGDNAGAVESYTRGIDAAQQAGIKGKLLSQLHSNRAQALIKLGRASEALEDCEAAVASDTSNAKAYWRGASAALKLNQPATAAEICKRGIRLVGDSLGLQSLLEEAEEKMVAQESGAADEEAAADPAAKDPQDAASEGRLSNGQNGNAGSKAIGQSAPANWAVATAQELADSGMGMLRRYKQMEEANRDEEDARGAKRLFERALAEDPHNETALLGLGEIFDEGIGVPREPVRAGQFWLKAQEGGSRKAQIKLCLQGLDSWAMMVRAQALSGGDLQAEAPPNPRPQPAGAGVFKINR
jgi:tetratricopeptide (TPR) repeat protein